MSRAERPPAESRAERLAIVRDAIVRVAVRLAVDSGLPTERIAQSAAIGVDDLSAELDGPVPRATLHRDIRTLLGAPVGRMASTWQHPHGANLYALARCPDIFRRILQAIHKRLSKGTKHTPRHYSHRLGLTSPEARAAGALNWAVTASRDGPLDRHRAGWWLCCKLRDIELDQTAAEDTLRRFQETVTADKATPYTWRKALATFRKAWSSPARPMADNRSRQDRELAALIADAHGALERIRARPVTETRAEDPALQAHFAALRL
jgi:hypothetical protein